MPLDPSSFDSGTPRTLDGREYPEHLRRFHIYDRELLTLAARLGIFGQDQFVVASGDPAQRFEAIQWLESALWRGLIAERDATLRDPETFAITERGRAQLAEAA